MAIMTSFQNPEAKQDQSDAQKNGVVDVESIPHREREELLLSVAEMRAHELLGEVFFMLMSNFHLG